LTRSKGKATAPNQSKKSGKSGKGQTSSARKGQEKKKRKVQSAKASVDAFAAEAESKPTGWYETWKKPAWMPAFTLTAMSLALMVKEQEKIWATTGIPSTPLEYAWTDRDGFSSVTLADVTLCFLTGMAVLEKDIREVFKLTAQFVTGESFVEAVAQAFTDANAEAKYDFDSPCGCILALCYAPAKFRRTVREIGQNLMKKEARMPESVSTFEAEVGAINSSLKAQDRKFQEELKILQKAVKDKLAEKEVFEKETSEFRNFVKEYYSVRSGQVDANVKQQLVIKYNASEVLRSKYSLEQFINLYGQSTAIKRVEERLDGFRRHKGFEEGCKWLESLEEGEDAEAEKEDESMEESSEEDVDEGVINTLAS
jgi:hypothetical protein